MLLYVLLHIRHTCNGDLNEIILRSHLADEHLIVASIASVDSVNKKLPLASHPHVKSSDLPKDSQST